MSNTCVCPVCAHTFAAREAYCEDWKVPEKSFGCPKCGTFLERQRNERVRWAPYLGWVLGMTTLALAVMYAFHENGQAVASRIASVTAIIGIPILNAVLMRRFTVTTGPSLVPYPQK